MVTQSKPVEQQRVRLDKLVENAEKAAETADPEKAEEFALLLRIKGPRMRSGQQQSMLSDLLDFVMPTVSDPSIFHTQRCIRLLQHVVSEIIPNLDESEELRSLATVMLNEEIERQRDLQNRRNGAIAV